MTINITLGEMLNRCNNWEEFCQEQGYSVYCVAEGGGDHEIIISENTAIECGLISAKKE